MLLKLHGTHEKSNPLQSSVGNELRDSRKVNPMQRSNYQCSQV